MEIKFSMKSDIAGEQGGKQKSKEISILTSSAATSRICLPLLKGPLNKRMTLT